MTFEEYQTESRKTALYRETLVGKMVPIYLYPTLGLAGETGEIVEKIKKLVRNDDGQISSAFKDDLKKELGDVLWYLTQVAAEFDLSLDDIARANITKLQSRLERGLLHKHGGDNR